MKVLPVVFLFILITTNSHSQSECGTGLIHSNLMKSDSIYKLSYLNSLNQSDLNVQNDLFMKLADQNYRIPVVVHIIHLGEPTGIGSNIPDSSVIRAIQGLNDRFSNLIGNGLDVNIEFCLAIRDPEGHPTNGIIRVDGTSIKDYKDLGITAQNQYELKSLSLWPNLEYYNIWVVHRNSYAGVAFANYPNNPPYFYDGTVITASYMSYSSSTLTHELGHALFLYHTFEGDGNNMYCPENGNCWLDGDRICDTPPHKQSYCDSNLCESSANWDNSKNNYMSYCSRPINLSKFTPNQKGRMQSTLFSYPRNQYLSSFKCTPCEDIKLNLSLNGNCKKGLIYLNSNFIAGATYHWTGPKNFNSLQNYTYINYQDSTNQGYYKCEMHLPGCTNGFVDSIFVFLFPSPHLTLSSKKNVSCYGKKDGNIELETSGGYPPYQYYWSNDSTGKNLSNLSAGLYSVTVSDLNECTSILNIEINEPEVKTYSRTLNICSYDSAFLQGKFIRTNGRYFDSFIDSQGCDSLVITDLSIYPFLGIPNIEINQNILSSNYTSGNQWYLNDSIILNANLSSFVINRNGKYYVVVTDSNGCSYKSNIINYPVTTTKNLLFSSDEFIIANLIENKLNLNLIGTNLNHIIIYNSYGQLIFQSTDKNIKSIDLTNYTQGVYIIILASGKKLHVARFLKS